MKPGETPQSVARTSRAPRSAIFPSAIATSAARPGAPLPSTTVPPRTTMSGGIDHELEQVAVRVAHVHARRFGPAAALPLDGAFLDLRARPVQEGVQRLG